MGNADRIKKRRRGEKNSVRGANHFLPGAAYVVDEAEAWSKQSFVREVHSLAGIPIVAGKHHSRRCVDVHLAGLAAQESILLEMIDEASLMLHRKEGLPAQTAVQRQP